MQDANAMACVVLAGCHSLFLGFVSSFRRFVVGDFVGDTTWMLVVAPRFVGWCCIHDF